MNKTVITRILLALGAYGIFVALVVTFYDDSPDNMEWKDREAYNRQFIAKVKLDVFSFEQALEELGIPDITDRLFALLLRQHIKLGHRIVALPGLQDFGLASNRLFILRFFHRPYIRTITAGKYYN